MTDHVYTPEERERFMRALVALNPDPKSELNHSSPFELLVAVMLSAQATDKGVNLSTAKLFAVANTPEAILDLGLEGLIPYVSTINLYPTKARHIIETCQILVDQFDGEVPRTMKELTSLPGVGRKTANVVMNVAFGMPTIAVDTHIFRVCNRTGFAPGKTPTDVEKALLKTVPEAFLTNAHHWFLLFGRYLCTARRPKCLECPVAEFCNAPEKAATQAEHQALLPGGVAEKALTADVTTSARAPRKPRAKKVTKAS